MRIFQIVFISIIFIFVFSCKKKSSNLSQVTVEEMLCPGNGHRSYSYLDKYKDLKDGDGNTLFTVNKVLNESDIDNPEELEAYTKYISTQNLSKQDQSDAIEKIFGTLSNVPEEYLDYAFKERKISVNIVTDDGSEEYLENNSFGRLGGLTFRYDQSPFYATKILYAVGGALVHEFGHAVESYIYDKEEDKNKTFAKDLETLSNLFIEKYKNLVSEYLSKDKNLVDNKQRSQQERSHEAFAELFDSWYCSIPSRRLLKEGIIDAYKFAKKYLIVPYDFEKDDLDETDLNIEGDITIGVIQDKNTKKIWANQGKTKKTWEQASNYCENLKVNNLSFKLPSCEEITKFYSRYDRDNVADYFHRRSKGAMFGFSGSSWSADTDKDKATVCDQSGKNGGSSSKTEKLSFLCVSSSTK